VFYYGFVVGADDPWLSDETTPLTSAAGRRTVGVVFCTLSLGTSLWWMLRAYGAVRAAPYMSHR
jgi:hypothetical protein